MYKRQDRYNLRVLSFKNQNCSLTLREGIEEYNDYLRANGKEVLAQLRDSSIVQDHDVTHVIFGLDTTLEEESLLDTWVLWCCSYRLSHLMSYSKQPEIKDLYKKLLREVGIFKFLNLSCPTTSLQHVLINGDHACRFVFVVYLYRNPSDGCCILQFKENTSDIANYNCHNSIVQINRDAK